MLIIVEEQLLTPLEVSVRGIHDLVSGQGGIVITGGGFTSMISFKPDYVEVWTARQAEEELDNFKFDGPGWYYCGEDVMLVLACERPARSFWEKSFDETERFEFNIYNERNPEDVFALIAEAPRRHPYRHL
jgi:hypothetical protein